MPDIEYRVNEVAQETDHQTLTARQILKHAEIDPELHFLVENHPDHVSYQDRPDESIHMVPHMRFVTEHQLIQYKVNDEDQTTLHRQLKANEILTLAGIDSTANYLSEIFPEHESFEGRGEEKIHMRQHMKFISVSIKPTPVSER